MKIFSFKKESIREAVLKSIFLNLLTRSLGFLKYVVIAAFVGFNSDTDAFFLAFSLINFFLVFTYVFDVLGIPYLVKTRKEGFEKFQYLTQFLLTFTVFLAISVTFLAAILIPIIVNIIFGVSKINRELVIFYYLFLIPYIFFNFFFHHFGAIHRSLRQFTIYFLGTFLINFFSFIFILMGLLVSADLKLILPLSFDLAIFISTIYIALASKRFWKFRINLDKNFNVILRDFIKLSIVYLTLNIYVLVDRFFASYLPSKSISALTYGWMIAMIPVGILKLENIIITPLAEANADWTKTIPYIKKIFVIGLILSLLLFIFAPYLVNVLFNYGNFSFLDLKLTIDSSQVYGFALPFVLVWGIIFRIYQIKGQTLLLLIPIITTIFINFFLNYFFVFILKKDIVGIALATDIAYFILVLISLIILMKRRG